MGKADGKAHNKADYRRRYAVGANASGRACSAEVVGKGCAHDHAKGEEACVTIALACHEKLPSGAAACQGKGKASSHHAHEVPHAHGVGYGLALEAEVEAAGCEVGHKGCRKHGAKPKEEVGRTEEEKVTQGAHCAEAALLGTYAYDKGNAQGNEEGACLEPGPDTE